MSRDDKKGERRSPNLKGSYEEEKSEIKELKDSTGSDHNLPSKNEEILAEVSTENKKVQDLDKEIKKKRKRGNTLW